jgi:indole-3-glycerol phosphate synthase
VDIETTLRLMPLVPKGAAIVSQSGISRPEEAKRLFDAGVAAIQVGESLMRAKDPGAKIRELLSLID